MRVDPSEPVAADAVTVALLLFLFFFLPLLFPPEPEPDPEPDPEPLEDLDPKEAEERDPRRRDREPDGFLPHAPRLPPALRPPPCAPPLSSSSSSHLSSVALPLPVAASRGGEDCDNDEIRNSDDVIRGRRPLIILPPAAEAAPLVLPLLPIRRSSSSPLVS